MLNGVPGLLVSAAVGYLVIERAEKLKGSIRRVGFLVGTLIVVVSILSLAGTVSCGASGSDWAPFKRGGYCPMTGKAMK